MWKKGLEAFKQLIRTLFLVNAVRVKGTDNKKYILIVLVERAVQRN